MTTATSPREKAQMNGNMVNKNEMKSPMKRPLDEKDDKGLKKEPMKPEEQRGPRDVQHQTPRNRDGQGGERDFRGGRMNQRGGRGGRGNHMGSGPRGDGPNGPQRGPSGPRDRQDRGPGGPQNSGQYGGDQPQVSLEEALPAADKKFTGRCRLFVGNMPADTTEEEFKDMFKEFGEYTEVFLNSGRGFGFIRMDYKKNAEAAKNALDGVMKKGRTLRVRFATHGAALRVKYLAEHVTNELLAQAFSIFGELERAVIIVDDRGKPTGDGIVEFARKPGAQAALKRISEGVFLLGSSPRPITVEPLEQKDEEDGYPEKFVQKSANFQREREQPPRFAPVASFEFDFGNKWKELYQMHEEQQRNLKRQFEEAIAKIEIEQAGAMMEHQTNMLRQDLLRRQEELRRLEELHQMELQKRMERVNRGPFEGGNPFRREDERRMNADEPRRPELEMRRQEDRRQQELFAQQERAMREMRGDGHGNAPPMQPPPAPPVGLGLERGQGGRPGGKGLGNHGEDNGMGGNFEQTPLRQSRFDQPPVFNPSHGGMPESNMGLGMPGAMGGNHGNMMGQGMGRGGGNGNMNQQERMMQERQMQERQMQERQMQERQGRVGQDRMRDDFFDAKRPRRY